MTITDDTLIKSKGLLQFHEGLKNRAYLDIYNNITAGMGHNLSARDIANDIIIRWANEDITEYYDLLTKSYSWYSELDTARQIVLIDLAFMGWQKFVCFTNMLRAFANRDYETAANELENSLYARQLPGRANYNAKIIREGVISWAY